jgi:negative regulator of replication initiation
MPSQPRTPQRTIRIDDRLWHAVQTRAAERGETVSDVVRRALERYVADDLERAVGEKVAQAIENANVLARPVHPQCVQDAAAIARAVTGAYDREGR